MDVFFLYTDYSFSISEFRKKIITVVDENELWIKYGVLLLITFNDSNRIKLRITNYIINSNVVRDISWPIGESLKVLIED